MVSTLEGSTVPLPPPPTPLHAQLLLLLLTSLSCTDFSWLDRVECIMDTSRPRSMWHGPHSTTGPASERRDCKSQGKGEGGEGGRMCVEAMEVEQRGLCKLQLVVSKELVRRHCSNNELTDILWMNPFMWLISLPTNSFIKHMHSSFTPNLREKSERK